MLFVAAKPFPTDQGRAGDPASVLAAWVGEVLAQLRDACGHLAALGGTPSPLTAAAVGVGALVGANVLRTAPRALNRSRVDRDLSPAQDAMNWSLTEQAMMRRPATAGGPLADGTATARDRARRISGVHDAVAQLDAEWLAYEQDLEAYYLTKPVLRDLGVAETAAYRSALYDLRNLAEMLGRFVDRPGTGCGAAGRGRCAAGVGCGQ